MENVWIKSKMKKKIKIIKYLENVFTIKSKTTKLIKYINDLLIDLRNSVNSKEIPKNENPIKIINTVEKIPDFNKQQKGKPLKISSPKYMLQSYQFNKVIKQNRFCIYEF